MFDKIVVISRCRQKITSKMTESPLIIIISKQIVSDQTETTVIIRCLLHNDLSLHACSLMWLAVVAVLSGNIKLGGGSLTWGIQVVLVGQSLGIGSSWDGILIKHNVVWESSIVGPCDGVSLGDGHACWLEDQSSCTQHTQTRISHVRRDKTYRQ